MAKETAKHCRRAIWCANLSFLAFRIHLKDTAKTSIYRLVVRAREMVTAFRRKSVSVGCSYCEGNAPNDRSSPATLKEKEIHEKE
jgi:hypothetical protein